MEFLRNYTLVIWASQSYIDFEQVESHEETLKSFWVPIFSQYVDLEEKKWITLQMIEHRTTLQDSWFDFNSLAEPKELSYMNIDRNIISVNVRDLPTPLSIEISLSNRVFV